MESTYGDRDHRPLSAPSRNSYEAIAQIRARGGNAIIPTFALERAQELLFYLKLGLRQSKLPPDIQIFVDSPMAISATQIARRIAQATCALRSRHDCGAGRPFTLPRLRFTKLSRDSMAINSIASGAVIMAGPAWRRAGRVLHHLRHNWRGWNVAWFWWGREQGHAGAPDHRRRQGRPDLRGTGAGPRDVHTINGFRPRCVRR
ncbi:MAG: hypothetical protein U1E30_04655 [Rhodoblastus sp.]